MAAHGSFDQPLMREAIEPALLAVAGCRRKYESKARGMTILEEAPLEREDQLIRRADANEARHAHRVAIPYDGDRLIGGDDLVFQRHPLRPLGQPVRDP